MVTLGRDRRPEGVLDRLRDELLAGLTRMDVARELVLGARVEQPGVAGPSAGKARRRGGLEGREDVGDHGAVRMRGCRDGLVEERGEGCGRGVAVVERVVVHHYEHATE